MPVDDRSRSFLDPDVLANLARAPLFARRPMHGSVSGRHRSPHRGSSVEFAEYRKYVPGDDLRRLHWRAMGRTGRRYVKEFEADTNLRCCLVVDTSGSMRFGPRDGLSKIDYAKRLAATLGYLAVQQGDAVGLSCVAEGVLRDIPPRRNPAHLQHVFDTLEAIEPRGETALPSVLHELAETISKRALIVVISDLFADPKQLRECFEHLRFRSHDVAAFHLLARQELEFPFQRPTRFVDLEGGDDLLMEPAEIADGYRQALGRYLEEMRRSALETDVDYHRVRIDDRYEDVLRRFLIGRAQQRGAR